MNQTIYSFDTQTLQGKPFSFSELKGKVVMVVNTASKCGHTPQLEDLEWLYEKYKDQGFTVIGFPSDQFAQEPLEGDNIETFCSVNYGVTFPIMEKIKVKGEAAHPVFQFFSNKKMNGKFSSEPRWNFYKYLIGRDGKVIDHYWTWRKPRNRRIVRAIESALK